MSVEYDLLKQLEVESLNGCSEWHRRVCADALNMLKQNSAKIGHLQKECDRAFDELGWARVGPLATPTPREETTVSDDAKRLRASLDAVVYELEKAGYRPDDYGGTETAATAVKKQAAEIERLRGESKAQDNEIAHLNEVLRRLLATRRTRDEEVREMCAERVPRGGYVNATLFAGMIRAMDLDAKGDPDGY